MSMNYRYYFCTLLIFYSGLSFWMIWINESNTLWLGSWNSDKLFIFFILIPLIIGYSIIDRSIEISTPLRFDTRKRYHSYQLLNYWSLTLIVISIFFSMFLISSFWLQYAFSSVTLFKMLNMIARFFIGGLLASNFSLLFQRTNFSILSKNGSLCTFICMFTELFLFVTLAKNTGFPFDKIIFAWIFDESIFGIFILLLLTLFSYFILFRLIKKKDFI